MISLFTKYKRKTDQNRLTIHSELRRNISMPLTNNSLGLLSKEKDKSTEKPILSTVRPDYGPRTSPDWFLPNLAPWL